MVFATCGQTRTPQLAAGVGGADGFVTDRGWCALARRWAVGAALGLLAGLLGSRWSTRIAAYHLQPRSWSLRAVAALLAVAATMLIVEAQDFDENLPMQRILAVTVLLTLAWFVGLNIRPTAKTLSNR